MFLRRCDFNDAFPTYGCFTLTAILFNLSECKSFTTSVEGCPAHTWKNFTNHLNFPLSFALGWVYLKKRNFPLSRGVKSVAVIKKISSAVIMEGTLHFIKVPVIYQCCLFCATTFFMRNYIDVNVMQSVSRKHVNARIKNISKIEENAFEESSKRDLWHIFLRIYERDTSPFPRPSRIFFSARRSLDLYRKSAHSSRMGSFVRSKLEYESRSRWYKRRFCKLSARKTDRSVYNNSSSVTWT